MVMRSRPLLSFVLLMDTVYNVINNEKCAKAHSQDTNFFRAKFVRIRAELKVYAIQRDKSTLVIESNNIGMQ